jgi:hypothetical protein
MLQILLLPPRPRILIQMPLHIALFILERASAYLKQPHTHARPHLCQLHRLIARFDKDVVSDFDCVFDVFEAVPMSVLESKGGRGQRDVRNYAIPDFGRALTRRK